jgi:hypothetical protein
MDSLLSADLRYKNLKMSYNSKLIFSAI